TAVLWYGFWTFISASAFLLLHEAPGDKLALAVRAGLFLVFLYWQFMPILSASMGSGLDLRKLLVFPVPHARLFEVEVLLRVLTGAEMVLVLIGGMAGAMANPRAGGLAAAPRILMAGLLFGLFNVLLSSGLRSVLERLLSRHRVREAVVVIVLIVMMLPRLLFMSGSRPSWLLRIADLHRDGMPWSAAGLAAAGEHTFPWLFG